MITAKDNTKIKDLKKLQQRKYRKRLHQYLIEGFHLVEEAFKSSAEILEVYVTPEFLATAPTWLGALTVYEISPDVLNAISELPAPQGIIAKVKLVAPVSPEKLSGGYLLLDTIQDPGNLGTMIRTADAFGISGVVLGAGTSDLYQTKVLRALQGSQYHLPVYEGDLHEWIEKAHAQNVPVYGTELNDQAIGLNELAAPKDFLVILGNEGQGVAKDLLAETTQNIYIPMSGRAESLNVGVACGIVLYHFAQK